MIDHDRDKVMQIAAEYGKLGKSQCEMCRRKDELVDQMVEELVRVLNEDNKDVPELREKIKCRRYGLFSMSPLRAFLHKHKRIFKSKKNRRDGA